MELTRFTHRKAPEERAPDCGQSACTSVKVQRSRFDVDEAFFWTLYFCICATVVTFFGRWICWARIAAE
jgi:hypothetical protein